MRTPVLGGIAAFTILTAAAGTIAADPGPDRLRTPSSIATERTIYTVQPESRLWVEGNSTVRRYRCEAQQFEAEVAGDPAKRSLAIADLATSVREVNLQVQVGELRCGDRTMEGHLRKALKDAEHPMISYRLVSHQVVVQGAENGKITLEGALTIAGQERPLTMEVEAIHEANGSLRIKGSRELRMTEFGVRPPTLMLGTMRVHDPVTVHFDILLR